MRRPWKRGVSGLITLSDYVKMLLAGASPQVLSTRPGGAEELQEAVLLDSHHFSGVGQVTQCALPGRDFDFVLGWVDDRAELLRNRSLWDAAWGRGPGPVAAALLLDRLDVRAGSALLLPRGGG